MRTALILLALFSTVQAATPANASNSIHRAAGFDIEASGALQEFVLTSRTDKIADGLEVLTLTLRSAEPRVPPRLALKWSIPSHGVAGHWVTGRGQTKTIRPDWSGGRLQASMLAREAPVSALFGSDDRNVLTFALSDALNTISVGSGVREEDGLIYNEAVFFRDHHRR